MSALRGQSRLEWMDAVRGFAIILVIVWHAFAVPVLFGYEMPMWIKAANNFFLPFRMPTLMFLSGMLLDRSLSKSLTIYYSGKIRSLIWPYLIWAALHIVLFGQGLELTNPKSWVATGYLWFLFFIGTYYLAAPLLTKIPAWVTPVVMTAISIPMQDGLTKRFFYFGAFFYAGYLATRYAGKFERLLEWRNAVYFSVAALAFGGFSTIFGTELAYRGEYSLLSLMGILAGISIAKRIFNDSNGILIKFIGRNSLVYYLSHFPVMLGVLYLVESFGGSNIWTLAIPSLILSIFVGTLLSIYRKHSAIKWLFQAPIVYRSSIGIK